MGVYICISWISKFCDFFDCDIYVAERNKWLNINSGAFWRETSHYPWREMRDVDIPASLNYDVT